MISTSIYRLSILNMLLVVNMLWKLHRTSHPDEEKKNMIEDETNYSNQNSKMTSIDNYFKSKQLPNFITEMAPTFHVICFWFIFYWKTQICIVKKWRKNTNHFMTWLCHVTLRYWKKNNELLCLNFWRKSCL